MVAVFVCGSTLPPEAGALVKESTVITLPALETVAVAGRTIVKCGLPVGIVTVNDAALNPAAPNGKTVVAVRAPAGVIVTVPADPLAMIDPNASGASLRNVIAAPARKAAIMSAAVA